MSALLWLAKLAVLFVVSFIEKWTLYTYAFVGSHGGSFFDGAERTYDLLSSDLGLLLGNAYAGDAVAGALVLAALPSLAALLWVLLGDAGTPLNLDLDGWLLSKTPAPWLRPWLSDIGGGGGSEGGGGGGGTAEELELDVAAAAIGGGLVLVSMAWCLRCAANAVLLCCLGEIHSGAPASKLKAPKELREAVAALQEDKHKAD